MKTRTCAVFPVSSIPWVTFTDIAAHCVVTHGIWMTHIGRGTLIYVWKKHSLIIISALYIYLPIGKMTQKKIVITIWTTWTWMAVPCIPLITRTSVASDCIHTCSISVASVFSQCAFINVFILWKEKKVIKIYVCMYYLYKIWSRTKNLQC